jgi:hypothetical protein
MVAKNALKIGALAVALAFCGVANATVSDLTGQYQLTTSYTGSNGTYTFNYAVTNLGQGYGNGSQTGFDGLTVFIPTGATVIGHSEPAPYLAGQGYWSYGQSNGLELSLNPNAPGANLSQNMTAPSGYTSVNWWGQYTGSVYQIGSTAEFSITLSGVSVGSNAVGLSTYFGGGTPANGQQFVNNQYGNYTTFTTNALSAVAAVPEPETYAMMVAGLGLVGFMSRRRRKA